jgi:hypothetical protein
MLDIACQIPHAACRELTEITRFPQRLLMAERVADENGSRQAWPVQGVADRAKGAIRPALAWQRANDSPCWNDGR